LTPGHKTPLRRVSAVRRHEVTRPPTESLTPEKRALLGHIPLNKGPLADYNDDELCDWILRRCRQIGRRIQRSTYPVWIAALRAFDNNGTPATVRQTFYALTVARVIPKTEQGYKQVDRHLLKMRRFGLVPYDFLADNTRWMRKRASYTSLADFLERSQGLYRKAVWDDLDVRVEIWIEKDALAGVVYPITDRWDVPLMVTRGYSSETFVYEAAQNINDEGKKTFIYYFGDYDPSGVGIPQDVLRKLESWTTLVTFTRMAVNPDQITSMQLPTRPTKRTDSRAKMWFGDSVELDAIPPNALRDLVQRVIESHLPSDHLAQIARVERIERQTLAEIIENWTIQTDGDDIEDEEEDLDNDDIEALEDEDNAT
jgi:hypothetical protein